MVRFSCFSTHMHSNKSKKAVRQSTESMHRTFQDSSEDQELKVSGVPNSLNPLVLDTQNNNPSNTLSEQVTSSSYIEHGWKPEEMHESSSPESNREMHLRGRINKSMSLGTGLDREGKLSCGIDSEDEIEQGISGGESRESNCDRSCGESRESNFDRSYGESRESNCDRSYDASEHDGYEEPSDSQDPGMHVHNKYHKALVQGETTFIIGDPEQLEEGAGDSATELSGDRANNPGQNGPSTPPTITKSYSLPNMGDSPTSEEVSTSKVHVEPQGGSSQNSDSLDADRKEFLSHGVRTEAIVDQERDNTKLDRETDRCKSSFSDDNSNFNGIAKDWRTPGKDGIHVRKDYQRQSSVRWDELPNKEYKIKRIEEWVRMIDPEDRDLLQETGEDRTHVQEIGESSHSVEKVRKPSDIFGGLTAVKLEGKHSMEAKHSLEAMHSMEAAKNYISSLSAASTSAQLVNLGLVVIPFLSAFVSLKVLNLSGNAIVRITAGALPRGLHALNLSKNNISTIEGLRELTRLRVLDLSYNRIFRLGHGLASCSSLKELYLAGNKISEVEGLHRLLKLHVLDLRFNKISTAKCLGQLAANYSSLQAIRLEGNPAQSNVGDEQLKKYLQSLVPHLVYYNKQPIRASSSKEVVDRPVRSAIPTAQFDRGLRSEHSKLARKGIHSTSSSNKVPPSLMHGRSGQAISSSKQSKGRHGRVPLSGTKGTRHHHHYLDLGEKLLNLQANFSMRRSHSEGNLSNS